MQSVLKKFSIFHSILDICLILFYFHQRFLFGELPQFFFRYHIENIKSVCLRNFISVEGKLQKPCNYARLTLDGHENDENIRVPRELKKKISIWTIPQKNKNILKKFYLSIFTLIFFFFCCLLFKSESSNESNNK